MLANRRLAMLILVSAIIAACGKSGAPSADAPLTFAPADTPYAYANLEPLPVDVVAAQSRQMHAIWPTLFQQYDAMLAGVPELGEKPRKVLSAVLDELRPRDSLEKLREIGFKTDGRVALYAVGLVPVVRMELGDPGAFRAMVARVEAKSGDKLTVGKIAAQEYWQFGDEQVNVIVAIENTHLVATLWAPGISDTVKQALLGITKPAKNLADAGTLQAIAKQYRYSPYGEGFFDSVALVQRLSNAPTGTDLEIAKAMKLPTEGAITDPVCKSEILSIAQTFPRMLFGAENMAPNHITVGAQFEMAPALAQQFAAALAPAPGTGSAAAGLMDFSLAVPILKLKDFWIKQADAIAASPYKCAQLAGINESFRSSKAKIDTTIPPPFSDMTGVRVTISRFTPGVTPTAPPDVAGKVLIATTNPLAAIGMAQLAVPQLKDLKITTDGKPVALPAGLVPSAPPMTLAVSDKAMAIAAGKGEDADLGAFLNASPATTPMFMRMHFSGAIYGIMARYSDLLKAGMTSGKHPPIDHSKMFGVYEKLLRSADITFEANANGIGMHETVDSNPVE
ncbi:MAG: hypothetical protein ABI846_04390 [Rudaea sp.]